MKKLLMLCFCAFALNASAKNALKTQSAPVAENQSKVPPCTVTVSTSGTLTFYCAATETSSTWTITGSCTETSTVNCDAAYTSASECADRKVAKATADLYKALLAGCVAP